METTTLGSSAIKQIVIQFLDSLKSDIENDKLSIYDIFLAISKLDAHSNGYIKESELVTYDKAMKMLNIKNRNTFSNLCKKHNVKNVKINNMSVGFHISDIERLSQVVNR